MGRRYLSGGLEPRTDFVGAPGIVDLGLFINGGNYRVRGVETSLVARLTSGLSLEAVAPGITASWSSRRHSSGQTGHPSISAHCDTTMRQVPNLRGQLGSPLAGAPPLQGNIRARYDLAFNGYDAFGQIGAVHQSHSLSTTDQLTHDLQGNSTAYELPAFTTLDGALGVGKDRVARANLRRESDRHEGATVCELRQYYKAITVNRPRTIGLRFSYKIVGPFLRHTRSQAHVLHLRRAHA
jgi:outer membrane receptor protein involved in Fe transport